MNFPSSPDRDRPGASSRNPGDEAEPGTSQTGEDVCPVCNGSGKKEDQTACPNCGGTGRVIKIIGDA